MIEGLLNIAIDRPGYAYYPGERIGEAFSYTPGGWKTTRESDDLNSVHMYHSGIPRAAALWYQIGGNPRALDLAREITHYMTQAKMWGDSDEPGYLRSPKLTHWGGHFHGHAMMLRGILDYACAVSDGNLKEF